MGVGQPYSGSHTGVQPGLEQSPNCLPLNFGAVAKHLDIPFIMLHFSSVKTCFSPFLFLLMIKLITVTCLLYLQVGLTSFIGLGTLLLGMLIQLLTSAVQSTKQKKVMVCILLWMFKCRNCCAITHRVYKPQHRLFIMRYNLCRVIRQLKWSKMINIWKVKPNRIQITIDFDQAM